MLAENGVAPWTESAPLEAGAPLGQYECNCYTAGTFYRSATQVLVLLREVILFVLKGQRAGGAEA